MVYLKLLFIGLSSFVLGYYMFKLSPVVLLDSKAWNVYIDCMDKYRPSQGLIADDFADCHNSALNFMIMELLNH